MKFIGLEFDWAHCVAVYLGMTVLHLTYDSGHILLRLDWNPSWR